MTNMRAICWLKLTYRLCTLVKNTDGEGDIMGMVMARPRSAVEAGVQPIALNLCASWWTQLAVLCTPVLFLQTVQFSAAVIVTTPQKLAFVDVAKGIRMFARMAVPCAAVAENMAWFRGDDGVMYHPFGMGSGERIQREFGLPHLFRLPIVPALSAAGDGV